MSRQGYVMTGYWPSNAGDRCKNSFAAVIEDQITAMIARETDNTDFLHNDNDLFMYLFIG